jgi:pimeloyl-ACP methyl ester carboxylesterase
VEIVDRGEGDPLVLIPGLQGRWEYMRATVDALATRFRVITFPLCDEPVAHARFEPARGLDNYVSQVADVLDRLALRRATICGISFGGVVALRFAARHRDRTQALILASTPGPHWRLRHRHELYTRVPWIFGPLFLAETPFRVRPEIALAIPDGKARRRFAIAQLRTLAIAPLSLTRMANRARIISSPGRPDECAAVSAPTLVIHGEPRLDHVVNAEGTSEYAQLIRGAQAVTLENTGHLGWLTRPELFAATVKGFVDRSVQESSNSAA